MKLICYRGCHDFFIDGWIPHFPRFFNAPESMSWLVKLDTAAAYALPGREQEDWNKGGGISFNIINHHVDSSMWSWRFNPETVKFEYGVYSHVDGVKEVSTGLTEVFHEASLGEAVVITLNFDWAAKQYVWHIGDAVIHVNFSHNHVFCKEITANFGGNNPAPRKLRINVKNL